jgi:hypothetical protein
MARMPLMVTGGICRRAVAEQVIHSGMALAGMGTALSLNPRLPREWQSGQDSSSNLRAITRKNKTVAASATMAMVRVQLKRLSQGEMPDPNVSPLRALIGSQIETACRARQYRHWVEQQTA